MVITAYLDTSAAMKLLVDEAESEALVAQLTRGTQRRVVSSWLLHTELHCAARRHPDAVDLAGVRDVLSTVTLVDVTRGDLLIAGTQAPLRSNDAVHLATAFRLAAEELVTYDLELAAHATAAGLSVVAPSAG